MGLGGGKFKPIRTLSPEPESCGPNLGALLSGPVQAPWGTGLAYDVHRQIPNKRVNEPNTGLPLSWPKAPRCRLSELGWACFPGLLPVPKVPCCMAGNSLMQEG